jgi:hypothetical protein
LVLVVGFSAGAATRARADLNDIREYVCGKYNEIEKLSLAEICFGMAFHVGDLGCVAPEKQCDPGEIAVDAYSCRNAFTGERP